MRYTFIILLALIVSSCKTTKDISQMTEDDVKIEMTRGACYGKCPIYTIKVYEGGYTTLDASRFTKQVGKFSKKLSKKEYKNLVTAFDNANMYQYKEMYDNGIADMPLISIIYKGEEGKKIVRGKDDRPAELLKLQSLIENLYNEDDWILVAAPEVMEKAPVNVHTPPRVLKDQIIIKPKPGKRLPTFIKDLEQYGVRLITRFSEEQNLWLITYSTSEIEAERMLQIVIDHPAIEMAQFNKEVSTRGDR